MFIVPLYAILQDRSEDARSRVIAANNIVNALFMAGGAGRSRRCSLAAWSMPGLYLARSASLNLVVA